LVKVCAAIGFAVMGVRLLWFRNSEEDGSEPSG